MTNNEDYRKYLDSRFEGLSKLMSAQFLNVHDKLDAIEKQTTKTNGRVSILEDKESVHYINCPVKSEFEKVNADLAEYRMLKKYPKITIGIIAVTVLIFLYGGIRMVHNQDQLQIKQDNLKSQMDMVNTPVQTERGIELWPSGMVIDSIKKMKNGKN